jgi:Ion channel
MATLTRQARTHPARRPRAGHAVLARIVERPGRAAFALAFGALFFGGAIFSFVEDETRLIDGWWWAFVSMSTVGYGDIAPKTPAIRMLAAGIIACGIGATAIATAAVAGRVAEWRLLSRGVNFELNDDFDELLERVRVLKVRYQHDEHHDDRLATMAQEAIAAWRAGDDAELERAMDSLSEELSKHPEFGSQPA